jgi:hypothetical protein
MHDQSHLARKNWFTYPVCQAKLLNNELNHPSQVFTCMSFFKLNEVERHCVQSNLTCAIVWESVYHHPKNVESVWGLPCINPQVQCSLVNLKRWGSQNFLFDLIKLDKEERETRAHLICVIVPPEPISITCESPSKPSFNWGDSWVLLDEELSSSCFLPLPKMALLPQHTRLHIVAKPKEREMTGQMGKRI